MELNSYICPPIGTNELSAAFLFYIETNLILRFVYCHQLPILMQVPFCKCEVQKLILNERQTFEAALHIFNNMEITKMRSGLLKRSWQRRRRRQKPNFVTSAGAPFVNQAEDMRNNISIQFSYQFSKRAICTKNIWIHNVHSGQSIFSRTNNLAES